MKNEYDELFPLQELSETDLEMLADAFPALNDSEVSDINAECERRLAMKNYQENDVINEVEVCHKIPLYRRPIFGVAAMLAVVIGIAGVSVGGLLHSGDPQPNDNIELPAVAAKITTTADSMKGSDETATEKNDITETRPALATEESTDKLAPMEEPTDTLVTDDPTEPQMTEKKIDPIKTNPNITEVQTNISKPQITDRTVKTTAPENQSTVTTTVTWEVVSDPKKTEDVGAHSNPCLPLQRENGYTVQQAAGKYIPTNGMISYTNGHQITMIQISSDGRLSLYTNERNLECWDGKVTAVSRYDGDCHSFAMFDPEGYLIAYFDYYGEDSLFFANSVAYQNVPPDYTYGC